MRTVLNLIYIFYLIFLGFIIHTEYLDQHLNTRIRQESLEFKRTIRLINYYKLRNVYLEDENKMLRAVADHAFSRFEPNPVEYIILREEE